MVNVEHKTEVDKLLAKIDSIYAGLGGGKEDGNNFPNS